MLGQRCPNVHAARLTRGRVTAAAMVVGVVAVSACSSGGSGNGTTSSAVSPHVTIQVEAFQATSDPYTLWLQSLAKKVSADTNGAVQLKIYPNSQLVSEASAPQAVQSGSVGMGQEQDSAVDQFAKGLSAPDLPFLFTTWAKADALTESTSFRALQNQALAQSGLLELSMCTQGLEYFASKAPIHDLSDVSNLKVRGAAATDAELFGALHMNETTVSIGETYEALQLGTVTASVSTPVNILSFNWNQVAKNIDEIPIKTGFADLYINLQTFHKLSSGEQQILTRDAADMTPQCNSAEEQANNSALTKMVSAGASAVVPSADQLSGFVNSTTSFRDSYVASSPLAKSLYDAETKIIQNVSGSGSSQGS
jgi:TRAP-type C4-dicarboxylate transport system substrate-binding protein